MANRIHTPNIDEGSLNHRSEMGMSGMSGAGSKKSSVAGDEPRPDSNMKVSVDGVSKNDE
jgi:hypothetical protein